MIVDGMNVAHLDGESAMLDVPVTAAQGLLVQSGGSIMSAQSAAGLLMGGDALVVDGGSTRLTGDLIVEGR